MKPPDFEGWIFRLNVIVTGFVFFLLAPTTQIFSSKFPDKKDTLWLFPLSVVSASLGLWFLMRLALPWMIRKGIFEDRRKIPRPQSRRGWERLEKIFFPVVVLALHLLLLIALCVMMVLFMRSDFWERLMVNLP